MVIVVGASAVVGFYFFLKRRRALSEPQTSKEFREPPVYRSLFEPDDDELRALEREEQARTNAEKLETEEKLLRAKVERVSEFEQIWLDAPDKANTIRLLVCASESESANIFSQTAESVIKSWQENKIKNLTAVDLAELLDSHLKILPQQERFSGALFWLKQEIKNLREKSEEDF